MAGFYSANRYFRFGKNKISILNPCKELGRLISRYTWRIVLLLIALYVLSTTVCFHLIRDRHSHEVGQLTPRHAPHTLYDKVRIFCIINTYDYRHNGVAVHVLRTWAKHCNGFVFISDNSHEELEPQVFQYIHDDWARMRASFDYVYNYHFREGDWFLRANDDNFVVVENLRYMLQRHSYNTPIYFGCMLKTDENQAYMHAGSAIVLSKAALSRLVQQSLPNAEFCRNATGGKADEELGRCLRNVGVVAGDSRDMHGSHTILPFEPEVHLMQGLNMEKHRWYFERGYYEIEQKNNTLLPVSRRAISFHIDYMPKIYTLNYFLYKVKQFGRPH